jgi:hypothetical protein
VRVENGAVRAAALAGLLALAGCDWFSGSSSSSGAAPDSCPIAYALRPLANTAIFANPTAAEKKPSDVAFYGIIDEVKANCDVTHEGVRVALDIVLIGERGPSAKGDSVDLGYFVGVTGPDQAIISKKQFGAQIAIPAGAKRAGITDHIEEVIPLGGRRASDLNIAVGFQLGPDVVDFYRRFRGR